MTDDNEAALRALANELSWNPKIRSIADRITALLAPRPEPITGGTVRGAVRMILVDLVRSKGEDDYPAIEDAIDAILGLPGQSAPTDEDAGTIGEGS